jgi:hypothetical protein
LRAAAGAPHVLPGRPLHGRSRAADPFAMRILFHVTLTTMLRHFEGVLLSLADRGHAVRIASSERRPNVARPAALEAHERIEFISCPGHRGDEWAHHVLEMRSLRDYLRYLETRFDGAPKLRTRAARKMVQTVTRGKHTHLVARCPQCEGRLVDDEVGRMLLGFRRGGVANLGRMLERMEATIPSDPGIDAFLRAENPDVLLVTPLIKIGSSQPEFVKSAQALNVPVAFPVFSWDNLSTKGLIHVRPDRVLVWNERQRTEAVEMHGVPPEQVVVTGAPRFDDFFAMTPQPRGAFCAEHGLDASRPIVTYLCSSEFVAEHEVEFVRRWIDEVRRDEALGPCHILIRPHPREQRQWKSFVAPDGRVTVSFPRAINADQTLFDTLFHSAAIVGLNTSAQLEAGIVNRPVLTILAPEFGGGQQGTLHFHYLLKAHGGFVEIAADFQEHRGQLAAAVAGRHDREAVHRFIEQFLRPHGLDRPATPIMVEAIEQLAALRGSRDVGLTHARS